MSYPKMRSLYLDDIYGTKPTKKCHDKSLYRQKHQQLIRSTRKNTQQWHQNSRRKPVPYFDPNVDTQWRTNKKLNKSVIQNPSNNINQSLKLKSNSKVQKQQSMGNSILSGTGKNSLNNSNVKDPYFPHRYVSDSAYEKYCWTGNRSWTENPQEIIYLPSSKKNYFPKFN